MKIKNLNIYLVLVAIVLLLIQTLVFDNIIISEYAYTPIFLLLFIIIPSVYGLNVTMITGYIFGVLLDFVSGSGGAITIALIPTLVLKKLFYFRTLSYFVLQKNKLITVKSTGLNDFMLYAFLIIATFNTFLYLVENFGLYTPFNMIFHILISTFITMFFVYILQLLINDKLNESR